LTGLGALKKESGVDLFYVDAVASIGGVPVMTDECHIDLCLGGAQKCLSAPPGMSFLSVSERAWEIVEEVGYVGYDALMPFRDAQKKAFFPYTPYWHGTAGLNRAAELILEEGLEQSFARHEEAATYCRDRIKGMGLTLFPEEDAVDSPTVTAVNLPDGFTWEQLDKKLRERRMVAAGSLGPLDGKIFRIGHMGSQARMDLVKKAMDVLEEAIR
jgi:aspartate aminotransferase-like enzyme